MIQKGMDSEYEKVFGSDWIQEHNDYSNMFSDDSNWFDYNNDYDSPLISESGGINLEGLLGLFYDHF